MSWDLFLLLLFCLFCKVQIEMPAGEEQHIFFAFRKSTNPMAELINRKRCSDIILATCIQFTLVQFSENWLSLSDSLQISRLIVAGGCWLPVWHSTNGAAPKPSKRSIPIGRKTDVGIERQREKFNLLSIWHLILWWWWLLLLLLLSCSWSAWSQRSVLELAASSIKLSASADCKWTLHEDP